MIAVSYYTNEVYRRASLRLALSLEVFKLRYEIESVTDRGSHLANCRFKAAYLLWKLKSQPDDICWFDADCEVVGKPFELEKHPDKEIGLFKCGDNYWSTLVYLKNTERVKDFLCRWLKEHERHPDHSDMNIRAAIKDIRYKPWPPSYVWNPEVFPKVYPEYKPVILHYCLSRSA